MKDDQEELEQRIAEYVDGVLPPADAARLEVFLANGDPKLSVKVMGMIADRQAMRSLPKPAAPADLQARIMEAVERGSLLNGMENLEHPHRQWWQTKGAIAAGLALVLGCFSYFILQAVLQSDNAWHRQVAVGEDASKKLPAITPPAPVEISKVGDARALKEAQVLTDLADGAAARGTVTLAPSAKLGEEVARNQEAAGQTFDVALRNGFSPADSPQVALEAVQATQRRFAQGAPVLVTLVARDNVDPQRLQTMLRQFMTEDPAASPQQALLASREGDAARERAALGVGGTAGKMAGGTQLNKAPAENSYSGNTTVAGGALSQDSGYGNNTGNTLNSNSNYDNQTLNNSGQGNLRQQQVASNTGVQSNVASNLRTETEFQVYDPKARAFELQDQIADNEKAGTQMEKQLAETTHGKADAKRTDRSKDIAQAIDRSQSFAASHAPYRVLLRPDQLNQLAANFQVHSITRGTNAYVIRNAGFNDADQLASRSGQKAAIAKGGSGGGKERDDLPNKAAGESKTADSLTYKAFKPSGEAGSTAGAPVPTTPPPAPAVQAESPSSSPKIAAATQSGPARSSQKHAKEARSEVNGPADATTVTQQLAVQKDERSGGDVQRKTQEASPAADQWVECVILMEAPGLPAASQQINSSDVQMNRSQQAK